MPRMRLLWVDPFHGLGGVEGDIPDDVLQGGELVADADASPGPAGIYRLLSDEMCETLNRADPTPTLLHAANKANLVTWMESLPHLDQEAATAERVRKAVFDLVEARLAADWVHSSAIVTATESSEGGLAVVGRCVVIRPT